MAALTGNSIASTYKDLLQVSNSNAGVDATLRTVDDGEGTASALSISSAAIQVDNIKLDGNTVSATNSSGLSLHDDGGNGIFVEDGGQVGIGMTAPGAKLDVVGGVSYRQLILGNSIGNTVVKRTAISAHHYLSAEQPVNLIGMFADASDTVVSIGGGLGGTGDFNSATELQFHTAANTTTTNTTAALVIDSSQNVGIGAASPSYTLDVAGNIGYSGVILDYSDKRLKENIEDADLDLCYSTVKNLNLKRYKFIDGILEEKQDRNQLGWIAQEVEEVMPKSIFKHEYKYNQVYEDETVPAQELIEWEDNPTDENTKDDIKAWMDSNELEYNSGDTKQDLLDKIPSVKQEAKEERTEQKLVSEDVLEDCHGLSKDQIYATMFGAIQKLQAKVEALEAK